MQNIIIDLKHVNKAFGNEKNQTFVLNDINLYIRTNEFLTLLGPSGCGKTTTLRIIAGFEQPTSGDVLFEGKSMLAVPPNLRQINTVFQNYALFPHLNVAENIAFGLRIKKTDEKTIAKKVSDMLKMVNLQGFEKRFISSLSGGQQQRIAIARALVNQPKVLLLDEPLGALDLKLRKEMQMELKSMQQELGITFVYVTHDQEEALTMSDTIVIMNGGKIQQIGTPIDIYNEPKNAFVAKFIGESNIVDGIMHEDCLVSFGDRRFACVDKGFAKDEPVQVVIRPEDIDLVPVENSMFTGTISSIVFKGVHYEMLIKTNSHTWIVHTTDKAMQGSQIGLSIDPDAIHVMHKNKEDASSYNHSDEKKVVE